jgi:hypothetical protein
MINTAFLVLRANWKYSVLMGVLVAICLFLYPMAWPSVEQPVVKIGYAARLVARATDWAFWRRTVVAVLAVALLQQVLTLVVHAFGTWAHGDEKMMK